MDQNVEDVPLINQQLSTLKVPNEPIQKLMFYFTVLHNVIDFHFHSNYLNFNNPYFPHSTQMEEFLALAKALNPEMLHESNVIIFYDDLNFFNLYETHDIPNQFRVIDPNDATLKIFHKNYYSPSNVFTIDTRKKSFELLVRSSLDFSQIEDSKEIPHEGLDTESAYYDNNHENQQAEPAYESEITLNDRLSVNVTNFDSKHYESYRHTYNQALLAQLETIHVGLPPRSSKSSAITGPNSNKNPYEEEEDVYQEEESYVTTVNIMNKLVVTNDWIDYIYNQPLHELMKSLKKITNEEDQIRTRSIKIPFNIYFFLTIVFMLCVFGCSIVMIVKSAQLISNSKFKELGHTKSSVRCLIVKDIDWDDDSVIVPCGKCHHKAHVATSLSIATAVLGIIYILFVFYSWIRQSAETKIESGKIKTKSATINIAHILLLINITLAAHILAYVTEGFLIWAYCQHTYWFVRKPILRCLEMNSTIIVCYILIMVLYFKK